MCEQDKSVKELWEAYRISQGLTGEPINYDAYAFGGSKSIADELAALVVEGKKRATTSIHMLYDTESEPLPQKGDYSVILDGDGVAQCVIVNTKVSVVPFNEVDETFAYREGEGDRSLDYWRKVHLQAFSEELASTDYSFKQDMLVVCEEFEVVFKK